MSFFVELIKLLGGTVALVAAAAALAKFLTQHWLAKDLEAYKLGLLRELEEHKSSLTTELEARKSALQSDVETHKAKLSLQNSQALDSAKFEFEQQLIARRGEVDLYREGYKYATESEKQRTERLRSQIQRWALPIQGSIEDLTHRLRNITENDGYKMLSTSNDKVNGWSADYQYFISSTSYYFAQYFCWTRLIQQQLGMELFGSNQEMKAFLSHIDDVGQTISSFPFDKENGYDPANFDCQVFRLQQRAIGELLVQRSATGEQVMTYREFLDEWVDPTKSQFKLHVTPLITFLNDVKPEKDLRWMRLLEMARRLDTFSNACANVLQHTESRE
jgi:hypothetical protein